MSAGKSPFDEPELRQIGLAARWKICSSTPLIGCRVVLCVTHTAVKFVQHGAEAEAINFELSFTYKIWHCEFICSLFEN